MASSETNDRGEYGAPAVPADGGQSKGKGGAAGILLLLGLTAGIYALSPGARHWYKYGQLPLPRR